MKIRSSKSRKIDIFPKGLTHGFGPKSVIFPTCFFQAIQVRKMSFTIFQTEKTPLQAIKTRSSKGRKIDIFSKGLTYGFGPKMPIFPTCFFQAIQARKIPFTIFYNRKTPLQAIKTRSSKSRKIDIFPNPWFFSKNAIFLTCFFQGIQAKKMSFTIFQNEKTPLQVIKTRSSKRRKIDIFPKGLTHGFGPKTVMFPTCFFQAIQVRKMFFYDILERKNAFLGYKNKKFKKSKNGHFSKGVNRWFWSKMAIFPTCFFKAIQARKLYLRYSKTKKCLCRL